MSTFARILTRQAHQISRNATYFNKLSPSTQIRLISTDKIKSSASKTTDEPKIEDIVEDKVGYIFKN